MKRALLLAAMLVALCGARVRADDEPAKTPAAGEKAAAATEVVWETDFDGALARAKEEGKPAVVYLRADYCLFCKQMDKRVFTDPKVIEAMKRFVAIKVDLTRLTPAGATVQNRVKGPGRTPWLAFFDSKGKLLDSARLGYENEEIAPEKLAKILDEVE